MEKVFPSKGDEVSATEKLLLMGKSIGTGAANLPIYS